ncbi:MAG: NAD(P)/FAD-dependent oxidoreductase [Alphaproteobacteria bacterium]|nr:NAD(P)/FAD-dependent oxidoreductase [Alphaproteobacteria bacterium]
MAEDVIIVGGGPSGLAAACEAGNIGAKVSVLERLDTVGGLSRTTVFKGSRFDIGPHRFFTRNAEIQRLFVEVGAGDILNVRRLTRIFYNDRYFNYPLTPLNTLFGVGVPSSAAILASYGIARIKRAIGDSTIENFEDWVVDRFGRHLFETFFKTYTEKVWGIPCTRIAAEWAAQRIKGLSLATAVLNAVFRPQRKIAKSLVDEFAYPRLGAGQLYEKMALRVMQAGNRVRTGARVSRIRRDNWRVVAVEFDDNFGCRHEADGRYFLVSAPLTEMIESMSPAAPPEVLSACRALRYRNHLGVNLIVDGTPFPDNWIYVHSKDVGMARITNYANFSPAMASRAGLSPLTVEYFCRPGDEIWVASEHSLIERAKRELSRMKIVQPNCVLEGFVVRSEKAYPVIEIGYERHIAIIKGWLDGFENLLPIGRSGMFKYNNQDHAMATGLLAARTALGVQRCDPWLVNIDAEYHESRG